MSWLWQYPCAYAMNLPIPFPHQFLVKNALEKLRLCCSSGLWCFSVRSCLLYFDLRCILTAFFFSPLQLHFNDYETFLVLIQGRLPNLSFPVQPMIERKAPAVFEVVVMCSDMLSLIEHLFYQMYFGSNFKLHDAAAHFWK